MLSSGGGISSGLGLSSIKLESPAYYCTSYTPPSAPPPEAAPPHLISTNYGTLSLAPARSTSPGTVVTADNSVIRVKRMRRMSSETENDHDLRGDKTGSVADLQYYTGSPLGQTTGWTQSDIDQATSIGQLIFIILVNFLFEGIMIFCNYLMPSNL